MNNRTTRTFEIVAMGSSLGGIAALRNVISHLPGFFPAPIVIAQHMPPAHDSALAELLQRRTHLRVCRARSRQRLAPGTVYVLPSGTRASLTSRSTLQVVGDESRTLPRPSIDSLFKCAAEGFGPRAIGVILTGLGRDGAEGVAAVRSRGGRTIVQDPSTAEGKDMPYAAIVTGCADLVLPLPMISRALTALVSMPGTAELFDTPAPSWAAFTGWN